MIDPRACKVCPFLDWRDKLNLKEVAQYEALERYRLADGIVPEEQLPRYRRLLALRYSPPVIWKGWGGVSVRIIIGDALSIHNDAPLFTEVA